MVLDRIGDLSGLGGERRILYGVFGKSQYKVPTPALSLSLDPNKSYSIGLRSDRPVTIGLVKIDTVHGEEGRRDEQKKVNRQFVMSKA